MRPLVRRDPVLVPARLRQALRLRQPVLRALVRGVRVQLPQRLLQEADHQKRGQRRQVEHADARDDPAEWRQDGLRDIPHNADDRVGLVHREPRQDDAHQNRQPQDLEQQTEKRNEESHFVCLEPRLPWAEQSGTDANLSRALVDGQLVVVAHAHG